MRATSAGSVRASPAIACPLPAPPPPRPAPRHPGRWRRCARGPDIGGKINALAVRRPHRLAGVGVEGLGQRAALAGLAIVEPQHLAIGLEARAFLRQIGQVVAVGRVARRRVAAVVLLGDVLRRTARVDQRLQEQVGVGRGGLVLVAVADKDQLLAVRGMVVGLLAPAGNRRSVEVAGGQKSTGPRALLAPAAPPPSGWLTGTRTRWLRLPSNQVSQ